jgi:glycosyltransferase involved in cell wall biosynthesis
MVVSNKITVVIPVYNTEKWLSRCLNSVLNQTLSDIDVICVDDGSTDLSLAILKKFASIDSRIKIVTKEHSGCADTRNAAYPYLTGEYVHFMDSDDYIKLDCYESLYIFAKEQKMPPLVLFYKHCGYSKMLGGLTELRTPEDKQKILGDCFSVYKLYRTDFVKNIQYPSGAICCEDIPFTWQCVLLADRISVLPKMFYHYCRTGTSITSSPDIGGLKVRDCVKNMIILKDWLNKNGFWDIYEQRYKKLKKALLQSAYKLTIKQISQIEQEIVGQ